MTSEFDRVLAMGRRIAYFRKERGISAAELAERAGAGLTRSVIANLENGRKSDLSVQQLFAIADTLNAPASSLVGAGDRLRAALATVETARSQYMDAMKGYLESMVDLAIEADRADDVGPYEDLLENRWSGSTPARLTMAQPMSTELAEYIRRPSVAEGRYVRQLLDVLEEDMQKLTAR